MSVSRSKTNKFKKDPKFQRRIVRNQLRAETNIDLVRTASRGFFNALNQAVQDYEEKMNCSQAS